MHVIYGPTIFYIRTAEIEGLDTSTNLAMPAGITEDSTDHSVDKSDNGLAQEVVTANAQ